MISPALCKRKHEHRSIVRTRPRRTYCDGRKRDEHTHRTRSNDRPTRSIARAIIVARGRASRQSTAHTRIDMFATATTQDPRSRPRARSDARDARSRFAPRARKRPPRRSRYVARARAWIDGTDRRGRRGHVGNARARGCDRWGRIRVVERDGWIGAREVGRARREGRRRWGDGRDRGRSIRERILAVDRFGWVRV